LNHNNNEDLTITGPDAALLTIDTGDGSNNVPSDGDGYRIFDIDDPSGGSAPPVVTLEGLHFHLASLRRMATGVATMLLDCFTHLKNGSSGILVAISRVFFVLEGLLIIAQRFIAGYVRR